jgi:hypothetical protein
VCPLSTKEGSRPTISSSLRRRTRIRRNRIRIGNGIRGICGIRATRSPPIRARSPLLLGLRMRIRGLRNRGHTRIS